MVVPSSSPNYETFPENSNSQLLNIMDTFRAELLRPLHLHTGRFLPRYRTQTPSSAAGYRGRTHKSPLPEHAQAAPRRRGTVRAGAVRRCRRARLYPGSGMPGRSLVAGSPLPARHGMPALPAPAAAPRRAVPAGPVYRGCAPERSRDPAAREPEGAERVPRCRYACPAGLRLPLALLSSAGLTPPQLSSQHLGGLDRGFSFVETGSL